MKPDNSIDPFNTAAWMQEYPALLEQQRARQQSDSMPAGQAGFEQQLSELQLNSSDESSAEASSPDTRPVAAHGTIRRTEIGGSMQMPPQSGLRDNRFSSARYSADLPHAPLGGSTGGASQSDLHDSSADYISISPPEAWPTMQTKDGKNRGLWSRIKSGVGKAFGGSRSENSSGGWTSIVVHSELRMDFAKRSRAPDEQLISEFRNRADNVYAAPRTVDNWVSLLGQFSTWLQPRNLTLTSLLEDPDQLNARAAEFVNKGGNNRVNRALTALQDVRAGNVLRHRPSQEDERLISEFRNRARDNNYAVPRTVNNWVSSLGHFSAWLQPRDLTLAGLLEDPDQLNARAAEFVNEGGNNRVNRALTALQDVRAGNVQRGPSQEDERLISEFRNRARDNGYATNTVTNSASTLRQFTIWLQPRNLTLASLLEDPDQLNARAAEFVNEGGNNRVHGALRTLRVRARNVLPSRPSHPSQEDKWLISELRDSALSTVAPSTAGEWVTLLGQFSAWLQPRDLTLASLLEDPDQLNARAAEFVNEGGNKRVLRALRALQEFCAGNVIRPHVRSPLYPEDAVLVEQFAAAAGRRGSLKRIIEGNAYTLCGFAGWLQANNKPSLASRFRDDVLADDLLEYRSQGGDPHDLLKSALTHLRGLGPGNEEIETIGPGSRFMGRTRAPYPEDDRLIDGARGQALHDLGDSTAQMRKPINERCSRLRGFSEWLEREGRGSIVDRLNGTEQQWQTLQQDAEDFRAFRDGRGALHFTDLTFVRNYLQVVEANRALRLQGREQPGSPSAEGTREPGSLQRPADSTFTRSLPSNFDLQDLNGAAPATSARAQSSDIYHGLAPLLHLDAMRPQERGWTPVPESPSGLLGSRWDQLPMTPQGRPWSTEGPSSSGNPMTPRGSYPAVPGYDAGGSEEAGLSSSGRARSSEIYRGLGSIADLPFTPQDVLDDAHYAPPARSEPARSSEIYRGLGSIADLPSTPLEMRDDAQSRPVLSPAGRPPFFISPSGMPQELEDIGYLVGEDWQHGSQPVPDLLLDVLDNKMLLPSSRMAPQPVSINGETYSIALGPRGSRDAQLIHHPGPSSVPDARIGASTASASAGDRSGRVLGTTEWLGDEHIARDYELLAQELQQSNPNLAARTRLVDPLIAFQVGQGTNVDALGAFHRIVDDRNGNDTADFLFMPVNDAGADPHLRGSHWSLLLVDRRDRDRPVAYHYDSARGYNDRPAAMLARRVGANLQDAPISQQRNGNDCGVFVVDSTRALVSRLAARRQPDLNLGNLVVDRQALQNRLRG
ncbi:Ulp1 family isopeptidase [Bradyrhizobium sp. ma5]|uniref:Ulp1 family isopeptidase n=1 Tax=Bradyrhizobium sp. ma5 TaxID=3344828 RepID=UPI0035D5143C